MEPILTGLISGKEIRKCHKKRKQDYEYLNVKKGGEKPYLEEGWNNYKELKTTTKLNKPKKIGDLFEDKVWCVFSAMGFKEINENRAFKVPISPNANVNPKQIDIFVKDDEVAILVECKTAINPTSKSFRTEISEINGIRGEIINNINKHYGIKLKVGWIFATKNIIWNNPDLELAKSSNITVLRDDELDYYQELVKHIGSASKYQLLADIFADKKIPGLQVKIPAIKGSMGGTTFYSFVIEPSKLLKIAFISHRTKPDKETFETYQRMLNKKRLISIREYIRKEGGLFPNSITINFRGDKTSSRSRFEKTGGQEESTEAVLGSLYLPNRYKSAWIIDGQHRLYGFSDTDEIDQVTIPVIAFENLDADKQAKMFVDINSKQVRVSKSHLEDLYSDLLWDSKDESEKLLALASKLVRELGKEISSPLYRKIKSSTQTGVKDKPITIATLTVAIKKLNLLGQVDKGAHILRPGPLYKPKEPRMENSLKRAKKILIDYFNAFKIGVPANWDLGAEEGGYLCTNNGLVALLIVLKDILKYLEKKFEKNMVDIETEELIRETIPYTEPIIAFFKNASYEEIKDYRRQFGAAGQRHCSFGMMELIHKKYEDFNPLGLDEYIKEKYSTHNEDARNIVPDIQLLISNHLISTIKDKYGTDREKWWFDGVPEKVRVEVVQRQQKDPEHGPKEQYFDLLHYQEIILKNWDLFKEKYGFKEYGNSKIDQTSWFNELNAIRNKVAHPERGKITQRELEFLKELHGKLRENLKTDSTEVLKL